MRVFLETPTGLMEVLPPPPPDITLPSDHIPSAPIVALAAGLGGRLYKLDVAASRFRGPSPGPETYWVEFPGHTSLDS